MSTGNTPTLEYGINTPKPVGDDALIFLRSFEGMEHDGVTYQGLYELSAGGQGIVFVAEAHNQKEAMRPRIQHVIIKFTRPERDISQKTIQFDQFLISAEQECQVLSRFTGLPGVCVGKPLLVPFKPDVPSDWKILGNPRALILPVRGVRTGGPIPVSLRAVIPVGGCNGVRELENWCEIARALGEAIAVLHHQGVSHRDIKPENIVLRCDHGYWRDIMLIDFGSAINAPTYRVRTGDYMALPGLTPRYLRPERMALPIEDYQGSNFLDDLYALGVTLVEVLLGERVIREQLSLAGELQPSPNDFRSVHAVRAHAYGVWLRKRVLELIATDTPLHSALVLCQDCLLASVPTKPQNSTDIEPTYREVAQERLASFLAGLGELGVQYALVSTRSLRQTRRRAPLPIDGLRGELAALRAMVSREQISLWCQRYVDSSVETGGIPLSLDDVNRNFDGALTLLRTTGGPIESAIDMLRRGFGRMAQAVLSKSLYNFHNAAILPNQIVRALRLLVGVLIIRDGAYDEGRRLLDLFRSHKDTTVQWWVRFLDKKLDYHTSHVRRDPDSVCDEIGAPVPGDERGAAWSLSLWASYMVRSQKPLSERDIEEIRAATYGARSAYEAAYGALCFARALAIGDDSTRWADVLPTILVSAGHAVTRALPHELAAVLAVTATLVRKAFTAPQLADAFHSNGIDRDLCLVVAAQCALDAAWIYEQLKVFQRSNEALQVAAGCFQLCDAPEWRLDGLRVTGLALNNMRFHGVASEDSASVINNAIKSWRHVSMSRYKGSEVGDPGALLAQEYYNRYGAGIEKLWQTEGSLAVEIPGPTHPQVGTTLEVLRTAAERIVPRTTSATSLLEVGCGVGAELIRLTSSSASNTRSPLKRVWGVEYSRWCVSRAKLNFSRQPAQEAEVNFCHADILDLGVRPNSMIPTDFDLVLSRDVLCHISDKLEALRVLRRHLCTGGTLLMTDWIQSRPATYDDWSGLLQTIWFTNLETLAGYSILLNKAGFHVRLLEDHTTDMHRFFEQRHAFANQLQSDDAYVRRAQNDLALLREFSDPQDGPLGWLFVVAEVM